MIERKAGKEKYAIAIGFIDFDAKEYIIVLEINNEGDSELRVLELFFFTVSSIIIKQEIIVIGVIIYIGVH